MSKNLTGTHYPRARERGLASWKPGTRLAAVLVDVQTILAELVPEFGPQGNRGIAYRLTERGYAKSAKHFADVDTASGRGRRAGFIEWSEIVDPGFTIVGDGGYSGAADFYGRMERTAAGYRRDRQGGQPILRLIWVEAAGLVGMVNRFARPFGVPVVSGGGMDSITGKWKIALDIANRPNMITRVGVIADHDPHGLAIADSRCADISTFVDELRAGYTTTGGDPFTGSVEWEWLAVRPDQIVDLGLSSTPHPRGKQTVGNNAGAHQRTVQAEAIHPRDLRRIVRQFIAKDFDHRAWWNIMRTERDERDEIIADVLGMVTA